jgi:caffeoyl-CoA O-methyltransferase
LISLEADPRRAEEAREWIRRAGLAERVDVRVGAALDGLPRLEAEERFDLAFLDAAKSEYPAYLDWALRLVRTGGIIAADNTLTAGSSGTTGSILDDPQGQPGVLAMREFNRRIATDERLASTIVPVREGVSISVVRSRAG